MNTFENSEPRGPIPDMLSSHKDGPGIPDEDLERMMDETGPGQEIDPRTGELLAYNPHLSEIAKRDERIVEYPKETFLSIDSVMFRHNWRGYLKRLQDIDDQIQKLKETAYEKVGRIDEQTKSILDELKEERSTIRNSFRIHFRTKLYFEDNDFREAVDKFLHP